MAIVSRFFAPVILAFGLGAAALAPAPAHAQSGDDLIRVIVDVADVVLRGGTPYYRNSDYGHDDRLIVERDRYGRPVYYRNVQRDYRNGPPYGNAYGYQQQRPERRDLKCNKHGKCKATYYDARYDSKGRHDDRDESHDRRGRHGRDRDDD